MKKLKDILAEADIFNTGDKLADRDRGSGIGAEDPKDVQKLVDKLKNNQAIKLAVKKINMKTEVAPAVVAFAQLLNDQVPGALTSGRRQQIIKALKELE
jgi:hypothetical protein